MPATPLQEWGRVESRLQRGTVQQFLCRPLVHRACTWRLREAARDMRGIARTLARFPPPSAL